MDSMVINDATPGSSFSAPTASFASSPNKRKRPAKVAIATESFRSSHRAQLSLERHEEVEVLAEFPTGWARCRSINDGRTGLVPRCKLSLLCHDDYYASSPFSPSSSSSAPAFTLPVSSSSSTLPDYSFTSPLDSCLHPLRSSTSPSSTSSLSSFFPSTELHSSMITEDDEREEEANERRTSDVAPINAASTAFSLWQLPSPLLPLSSPAPSVFFPSSTATSSSPRPPRQRRRAGHSARRRLALTTVGGGEASTFPHTIVGSSTFPHSARQVEAAHHRGCRHWRLRFD